MKAETFGAVGRELRFGPLDEATGTREVTLVFGLTGERREQTIPSEVIDSVRPDTVRRRLRTQPDPTPWTVLAGR